MLVCLLVLLIAPISSTIINRLMKDQSVTCAYWYFDSGNANNNTEACLRSLTTQLGKDCETFPEDMLAVLRTESWPNRRPYVSDLEKAIISIVKESEKDVIIALDALDECPDKTLLLGSSDQPQMKGFLAKITENSGPRLRILTTSRPRENMQKLKPKELPLQDFINKDVEIFVADELKGKLAPYKEAIEEKLLNNEDKWVNPLFYRPFCFCFYTL